MLRERLRPHTSGLMVVSGSWGSRLGISRHGIGLQASSFSVHKRLSHQCYYSYVVNYKDVGKKFIQYKIT